MPTMDPTQLAILTAELTDDPEGIGYSGMGDGDAAGAVNAPRDTATLKLPIPVATVLTWMDEHGKTKTIDNNLIGPSPADEAKRYQLVTSNPHRLTLDPENAYVAEGFTDLRDVGLLTNDELAEILALAEEVNTGPSRADALGLGVVFPENVEQARES